MQQRFAAVLMVFVFAGCAGASSSSAPERTGERLGDPVLYTLLADVPLSPAADSALHEYELDHMRTFLERVSLVAEDPRAGVNPRFNAVRILGERGTTAWLNSLRAAARDRDPRVRAAVAVAAARIADKTGEGRAIVDSLLFDASPEVAAKALEHTPTSHLQVLRDFTVRRPRSELAPLVRDMLRVAEERGAPLAADSAGVLRRTIGEQTSVEFRPMRRWPEWDAAVGTATIRAGGATVQLDSIEVVRSVLPVFFSPEVQQVVYERGRRIVVRDLASGAVRELGAGVAPRPLPFTGDFVYLRELSRGDLRERTQVKYELMRASFTDPAAPAVIDTAAASTVQSQSGGYSPVRWARVVERNSVFSLEGEGFDPVHLPPAFSPRARP